VASVDFCIVQVHVEVQVPPAGTSVAAHVFPKVDCTSITLTVNWLFAVICSWELTVS
jgi:hypothetical protein